MFHTKLSLSVGLAALLLTAGCAEHPLLNNPSAATIDAAETPAEHEAVAKSYEDEARRLSKEADTHQELANLYKPTSRNAGMGVHCAALEKEYRAASRENLELAAIQHELAKEAAK
jgi:hypothetical protein